MASGLAQQTEMMQQQWGRQWHNTSVVLKWVGRRSAGLVASGLMQHEGMLFLLFSKAYRDQHQQSTFEYAAVDMAKAMVSGLPDHGSWCTSNI
jgi:hypothetical protein